MADTNNVIYAQQYSDNIMMLAQQDGSKLWPTVLQKTNVRGKTFYQDQIGSWSMSAKVGRNPNTPSTDPALARRMATMEAHYNNVLLDRSDDFKSIVDPMGPYSMAGRASIGRKIDDITIDALGGSASTGEAGAGSQALTLTIANASAGLTFAKVNQASRLLNQGDVPMEDRCFVTSPQGIEDLLAADQATSSDYTSLRAIQSGSLDGTWMGFKWIMSTRLDVASSVRTCFAYQRTGICVGLAESPFVRLDERADKSYSKQIYYELNIGAVRLEEAKVVQVDILES
jgi:hypothetical protein